MSSERSLVDLEKSDLRKITYDVKTYGDRAEITCHLPAGFNMPTFTRIYHLRHAKDYGMTEIEYINHQKDELFKDLLNRLEPDKRKMLE